MATVIHGSNAGLFINGCDMASYFYEFEIESNQAMHDATVFGNSSRVKVPGLKEGKASGSAFFDSTALTGPWAILKGMFTGSSPGTANPAFISFAPKGFTVSNPVHLVYLQEVELTSKILVDDLTKLMFSGEAEQDGIDYGVSLHALGAETVFPFTGTDVDNGASTANGGVVVVQVTALAGADKNITFEIQHSTDGSSWVDLVTLGLVFTSANLAKRVEVDPGTTVRRHLRVTALDSGTTSSVTFTAAFARR